MIRSIAAMGGNAAVEASGQPAVVRPAALDGRLAGERSASAGLPVGFRERLLRVGGELDIAPVALQSAMPLEPLPSVQANAQPAAERSSGQDESAQELTAEQWLFGMLDQQQAVVQARDLAAAQPGQVAQAASPSPSGEVFVDRQQRALATLETLLAGQRGERPPLAGDSGVIAASRSSTPDMPGALPVPTEALAGALGPAGETSSAAQAERLLAALDPNADPEPLAMSGERTVPPQGMEHSLKLHAPQAKWGEQMLQALREHVELQLQQRQQSASIRLDPPELGSLEIHLSHESGRLTVQLSAAHADVARLLQQTSDRLRQELVGQHFVQVNVQVAADGQSGQQGQARQRMPAGEEPVAANGPAEDTAQDTERSGSRARDVLVTV
ncbi:flagellar hook-length control protein FliK [Stutzerimonas stutzeri]|uniref:Flagellar hook-length control protein FliK n=1 Tax=Stutzerimonas stutzeri TaxID=316 RepID=A0A2N8T9M7_STUST|nr:flagellar hook-length control protein FliK [Stutzerimonas stutzeri]MCQ4327253.1 flagellar hook-length control protein FliK [Stutzerimonas stutzeri]PNG11406.1 flagellar hook-length control protein FliK [Stutzerimonas stutzeri]